ncbi:MAG: DUF4982 domain-containing protein [Clostridia bacterium]|nr:DUF4982 domain-containing protein [Clostridia bacterium]
MRRLDFNTGWTCCPLSRAGEAVPVTLPHDAMRTEQRLPTSTGEGNIGWFEGGDYLYRKVFTLPEEARGQHLELQFEGVYHGAEITCNGMPLPAFPYGYADFSVSLDGLVREEGENELCVTARNADQPNSRWYSGTGIYRPVWLWTGHPRQRVLLDGIRVTTCSAQERRIHAEVRLLGEGEARICVLDGEKELGACSAPAENGKAEAELTLPGAELWSVEHPRLYRLRVDFGEDRAETTFGLRTLAWDREKGLSINGERVVLRGACIHHDNGLLGACTYPEAEERRIRILKAAGYNAVRSAHNPASRYLLEACDRMGMLMMDEYVDCWYMHKTAHDYATLVGDWWQRDLERIVEKDYSHPCVIMYSTGNEVAESAQARGIQLQRDFTAFLHRLDPTRPVTCGINIFFNFLSSIGLGVYSDEKAQKQAQPRQQAREKPKKKSVGSEFFNNMAAKLGTDFMKFGAWLPPCDWKTREVFSAMDIAGYNYGNWRYRKDARKYPERLILGSETLIGDARAFWQMAKETPQLIGDFVWAGWDYIGECGGDSPEYGSWRTENPEDRIRGGTCRIDVTGKLTPEADYTRVVFDLEPAPRLAVQPPSETEQPTLTGWQLTRAIRSWTWPGCEGKPAVVEVYSTAAKVRLTLNGETVGVKRMPKNCRVLFRLSYQPGALGVEALDRDGRVTGRDSLSTAGERALLRLEPETEQCRPGGMVYLRMRYADESGEGQPLVRRKVRVSAENAEVMGTANGCTFFRGNYAQDTVPVYFGEAQAVVRAGAAGTVRVTVTDGEQTVLAEIPCGE